MKQLLRELTKDIVEKEDAVEVAEDVAPDGLLTLKLSVDPVDMGKVIGKGGKTINALRTLLRVAALRQGKRVRIELTEPQSETAPPSETSQEREEN